MRLTSLISWRHTGQTARILQRLSSSAHFTHITQWQHGRMTVATGFSRQILHIFTGSNSILSSSSLSSSFSSFFSSSSNLCFLISSSALALRDVAVKLPISLGNHQGSGRLSPSSSPLPAFDPIPCRRRMVLEIGRPISAILANQSRALASVGGLGTINWK